MESIAYETAVSSPPAAAEAKAFSRARSRAAFLQRLLFGADVISAVVAGLFATTVFGATPAEAAQLSLTLTFSWIALAFVCGLYNVSDLSTWASGLSDALRTVGAALLMSWLVLGVALWADFPHPIAFALVGTVATVSLDSILRALSRGYAHSVAPLRQRTVVVGSGMVAERLAERLERHGEFGLEPIGLVDDDVHTLDGTQRLPKLGNLEQLDGVLESQRVDRVIIAFSRASHQQLLSCIRTCRDHRVAVDVVPRLFELLDGTGAMSQIGGLPLLSIGAKPLNRTSRAAKRGLDIAGSALLLTILSPVLIAIAIAIKLDSRGPVFFRQLRDGRRQQPFLMIKFRSMYRDADQRKKQFETENEATDGVMFKIKRDPRVTGVGRFLRSTSLDELPQLINVLKGDMSLVGPRPLILEESRHAAQSWHARRLDLRPGITGLWQVSGRSDIPFQEMVRFDYQYVSGWSLARDVEILLATIPVVLSRRGAY
ncbi:MAG TPA: sugar transferase [Solirubrobacterales bacterium]|nr:sugar transferase [Solirubrobacterales bacterium]